MSNGHFSHLITSSPKSKLLDAINKPKPPSAPPEATEVLFKILGSTMSFSTPTTSTVAMVRLYQALNISLLPTISWCCTLANHQRRSSAKDEAIVKDNSLFFFFGVEFDELELQLIYCGFDLVPYIL